jgi:hypothetical protein
VIEKGEYGMIAEQDRMRAVYENLVGMFVPLVAAGTVTREVAVKPPRYFVMQNAFSKPVYLRFAADLRDELRGSEGKPCFFQIDRGRVEPPSGSHLEGRATSEKGSFSRHG